MILRWCVFTGLAGAGLAPFAILLLGQSGQVAWMTRSPELTELVDISILAGLPCGRLAGSF